MKNEKFCFSKATGLIVLLSVLLVGVLAFSYVSNKPTSTSTRAAMEENYTQADCKGVDKGNLKGVEGRKYYYTYDNDNVIHYFKTNDVKHNTKYEIVEGLGTYCTLQVDANTTCRDVRTENNDCIRPIYEKGDGKLYADSSCLGTILNPDGTGVAATKDNLAGDKYCGEQQKSGMSVYKGVPIQYDCPDNKGGLAIFYFYNGKYYANNTHTDEITEGIGNMCKSIDTGVNVSGLKRVSCGTLGGTVKKVVSTAPIENVKHDQWFYDIDGIYQAEDINAIKEFCKNSTPSVLLVQNSIILKVSCERFTEGGLSSANLYMMGSHRYADYQRKKEYKLVSAENICKGEKQTFTCDKIGGYKSDLQFATLDEVDYYMPPADTTKIDRYAVETKCVNGCAATTKADCIGNSIGNVSCDWFDQNQNKTKDCNKCVPKGTLVEAVCP